MHPNRRRKKRPNYGIRTVEVLRGPNGFGFTISGQQPCILSCIVANSPADQAGLRAGDFLISVNGISVSKITHDAVVNLIGNCAGPIKMTIAENYYSDSSDEEMDVGRMINSRKPKYMHKPRSHRLYKEVHRYHQANEKSTKSPKNDNKPNNNYKEDPVNSPLNLSNPMPMEDEAGPIEYKALVGYLGTIEMPKQLLPNSRLQTVCSCIRKLRQEKRTPTAVLMTIFPTCLTLKNSSNHILAIYPTNRVVYIGSTTDKDSRYFGIVTSAVCENREKWNNNNNNNKFNNIIEENDDIDDDDNNISTSCHVFMTDPKLIDHKIHSKKAENFKFQCTIDVINGNCLEFPKNSLYIVNLVQNMYRLQDINNTFRDDLIPPLIANSPQPSASSNSDSGIGFRDDCGNISDRILVVEFPSQQQQQQQQRSTLIPPTILQINNNNRPIGIDGELDLTLPLNNELNNIRCKNNNLDNMKNNLSRDSDLKQMNNLNNIRACEGVNIKNIIEKDYYLIKQNNNNNNYNRLTCRAMPDKNVKTRTLSPSSLSSDDNTHTIFDDNDNNGIIPLNNPKKYDESDDMDFKSSVDNISMHSSKSIETSNNNNNNNNKKPLFKTPNIFKRPISKMINSCENLDIINYKLSPKVYGLSKPIHSCEELNNLDANEKYGYGSLQELCTNDQWINNNGKNRRNVAQSEPDVRIQRNEDLGENGNGTMSAGPAAWATSFEKLLDDPLGLHTFAEFLKKEFSAENIYFWTACERYRRLSPGPERTNEAQRIYQQHLCVGAPEPVNVDAHGRRQCTEQSLNDPSENLFDQAQKQIFNLMKFDSYPRFLKSNLYKQCLSGDFEKPSQLDAGLLLQPTTSSSKLKKSLSNAEDCRRKSLLPWHRKNRSKSKDRGESEYNNNLRRGGNEITNEIIEKNGKNEIYSSRSSLTSLDLAIIGQDLKNSQDEGCRTPLCRVILSNGSTTVVQIKEIETIQDLVKRLLEKRGIIYSSFEVYTDKHSKALNLCESSKKLAGCEVTVEQRVVFKLDLPNRKVISVKSKYTKILIDVLRPILYKYNYNIDQVSVSIGDELVDLHQQVTEIDGARLNIQLIDFKNNPIIKVNNVKVNKLEEITNQVFEGILQEKADSVISKTKSNGGSVKSEDWGSEHSSGIFGKFLRRDSSNLPPERKKKSLITKTKLNNPTNSSCEDMASTNNEQNPIKKPLIAKWKAGVNKLQVTCSESDELVEGLTRAQRRLEDQRGTEINFELPDFLKDKENENFRKPIRRGGENNNETRFYIGEQTSAVSAKSLKLDLHSSNNNNNYENRNIINNNNNNLGSNQQSKLNNLRIYSTSSSSTTSSSTSQSSPSSSSSSNNKYLSSDESFKSPQSSPSKSLENTVIEKKLFDSPKNGIGDPPPLPPKPKIVPIKPPNWGQNGFYNKSKHNNIIEASERNKTLYLEQPSSSFV